MVWVVKAHEQSCFFYKDHFENHTSGGSYVVVIKDDIWDDHVNMPMKCMSTSVQK